MPTMDEFKKMLRQAVEINHEKMKAQNPDIKDLGEHELTTHKVTDGTVSKGKKLMPNMRKTTPVKKSLWEECYTNTTEGVVHGREVDVEGGVFGGTKVKEFLAVPYAKPPIGELRWKKPEWPDKYFGIRECDKFAPAAMQLSALCDDPFADPGFNGTVYSEDCLYLNVWTPAEKTDEKLPVAVWIHGGGMVNSTAMAEFRRAHFLAAHGVVVFCINYRLGFFGFLSHPELAAESEDGTCGNYALYDMKQAVEWVKANAEAFGGDPDNITVGGQSGGGLASNLLLVSPLMNGLFKHCIIESGTAFHGMMQVKDGKKAQAEGKAFLEKHGVESIAELRKMDPVDIIEMTKEERFVPNCTVDGAFIPEMPQEISLKHMVNKVDLICTATAQEFAVHLTEDSFTPEEFISYVKEFYGDKADRILELYPHSTNREAGKSYFSLLGDLHFIGCIRTCEEAKAQGLNARCGYFTRPVQGEDGELVGALHSSELPFLFGRVNHGGKNQLGYVKWEKADFRHADAIAGMWANFMAGGNTGHGWKKFEKRFDVFDIGEEKHMIDEATEERLSVIYDIISADKYDHVGNYILKGKVFF